MSNVKTVTLAADAVTTVRFDASFPYYWIDNQTDVTIYAAIGAEPIPETDGTFTVAAGGKVRLSGGITPSEIKLKGSGKVQVVASGIAECPFKSAPTDGGGKELTGNSAYSLENTVDYPLIGLSLYGKSTQNGTPTPENPVDIVSVGDSGSIEVQACGKNLIDLSKCNWRTTTINGLTFTINDNGEILVNGTATAATTAIFTSYGMQGKITSGQLILSGCPQIGVESSVCRMQFWYSSPTSGSKQWWLSSNSPEYTFTLPNDYTDYNCSIFINSGFTANNLVFKPMLRIATITDSTFEPYKGNTARITSPLPLCGIPVSSGGNYTDSNGQQWVCDELIYNADGTGKIVKYAGIYTFTGNENFALRNNDNGRCVYAIANLLQYKYYSGTRTVSDKYVCIDTVNNANEAISRLKIGETCCFFNNTDPNPSATAMYFGSSCTTLSDFKSEIAGSTIIYPLAKPQEIELTAAEMTAFRQLKTFDGTTSISNSSGAEMNVKYCTNKALSEFVRPVTMGLQKQIDELRTAILSMGGNV